MKFLFWTKKNSLLTSIVFGAILFLVVFFVPIYAYNAAIYKVSTSELIYEEKLITDSSIFNQINLHPLKNFKIGLQFGKEFLDQGAITYSTYAFQVTRAIFLFFSIYGSLLIIIVFTLLALINHKRASLWYGIEIITLISMYIVIYFAFFNIPVEFLNQRFVGHYYPYIGFVILSVFLALIIIYRALLKKHALPKLTSPASV